jgi:mono/diheme cytochrome c family protein
MSSRCQLTLRLFAAMLLASLAACDDSSSSTLPAGVESAPDQALVERGRYLAALGNCLTCHTREGGEPYAGGVEFNSQFGVLYSTNITPDVATGIGSWTAEDLRRAMHEGVAVGGKRLFPAFPYTSFTQVSDADVDAIYAFLRTIQPAQYTPPDNGWLLRLRWPMALWNRFFFQERRFSPDESKSEAWNRGAYLVEGLGHCSACHTPRNFWMAEREELKYTGGTMLDHAAPGKVRRWSAVNLTSSKQGLGSWSEKHLAQYLRTGFSLRGGTFGPMNAVIIDSLKHLTPQDASAMATYIKSLPAHDYTGEPVSADAVAQGEPIYLERCEKCHGESGRGGMFSAPAVAGSAIAQSEDPSSLINLIMYGQGKAPGVSFGAWEQMPAYAEILNDSQIAAVSNYVRGSWGNRASIVTPEQVAEQR